MLSAYRPAFTADLRFAVVAALHVPVYLPRYALRFGLLFTHHGLDTLPRLQLPFYTTVTLWTTFCVPHGLHFTLRLPHHQYTRRSRFHGLRFAFPLHSCRLRTHCAGWLRTVAHSSGRHTGYPLHRTVWFAVWLLVGFFYTTTLIWFFATTVLPRCFAFGGSHWLRTPRCAVLLPRLLVWLVHPHCGLITTRLHGYGSRVFRAGSPVALRFTHAHYVYAWTHPPAVLPTAAPLRIYHHTAGLHNFARRYLHHVSLYVCSTVHTTYAFGRCSTVDSRGSHHLRLLRFPAGSFYHVDLLLFYFTHTHLPRTIYFVHVWTFTTLFVGHLVLVGYLVTVYYSC